MPSKSVLKQRHSHTLPPSHLYQHPDPLLRRLRLVDGHGRRVDLKQAFRDVKVVLMYFGSQWNAREAKGSQKVIYISVDTEEAFFEAATRNKPWYAMEWNDGSSLDPALEGTETSSESFLLAGDADPDASVVHEDKAGVSYVRPFSRVYMADRFNVLLTPTIVAYHLPSGQVLDQHVRLSRLRPSRAEATVERWLQGQASSSLSPGDMLYMAPWTAVLAVLALFYFVTVLVGGEQYSLRNLTAHWL